MSPIWICPIRGGVFGCIQMVISNLNYNINDWFRVAFKIKREYECQIFLSFLTGWSISSPGMMLGDDLSRLSSKNQMYVYLCVKK